MDAPKPSFPPSEHFSTEFPLLRNDDRNPSMTEDAIACQQALMACAHRPQCPGDAIHAISSTRLDLTHAKLNASVRFSSDHCIVRRVVFVIARNAHRASQSPSPVATFLAPRRGRPATCCPQSPQGLAASCQFLAGRGGTGRGGEQVGGAVGCEGGRGVSHEHGHSRR